MWIITSIICVVAMGFQFNVYNSTRVKLTEVAPCAPVPTYRVSNSSKTLPGEFLYEIIKEKK